MRNRVYFNVREKNLSVLDYKTNKVTRKVSQVYLTNAMFVVRKSGNKRVREEGRKNVHAFVNGIIQNRLPNNQELFYHSHKVRYDPYTMDCFHYERIVNGKRRWLPVDKHWIGRVWIYIENGKPVMHADIDKLLNHFLLTTNLRPCNREAAETKTQRKLGANNPWSNTIFVRAPLVPGNLTTLSNTRYQDLAL